MNTAIVPDVVSTPAPNGPCAGLGCGMRIVRYGPGATEISAAAGAEAVTP